MPYPSSTLYPSTSLYPGTAANTSGGGTGIAVISPSFNLYEQTWRSGFGLTYRVDAMRAGAPITAATGLTVTGGSIKDTSRPGVRRLLTGDLVPLEGGTFQDLYEALKPEGTLLRVTGTIHYGNRSTLDIPMGVFDVDDQQLTEGGGGVSLTAPDKWARIARGRFLKPTSSVKGRDVRLEIKALIQGALGTSEPVNITATGEETMGAQVYEKDRDETIIDLAKDIGAWVYFDRDGICTIADVPMIGSSSDWLIDSSESGVLMSLDRSRSRTVTRNIVVVTSTHADGEKFPVQYVWDNDPSSPTYYGPGAGVSGTPPTVAGAFGSAPYFHDTPIIKTVNGARAAGKTILARTKGLASQVSLTSAPNPRIDAFSIIDVLAPRERADRPRVLERHVVDTVTHPLSEGELVAIDGRSTRSDEYVDGA